MSAAVTRPLSLLVSVKNSAGSSASCVPGAPGKRYNLVLPAKGFERSFVSKVADVNISSFVLDDVLPIYIGRVRYFQAAFQGAGHLKTVNLCFAAPVIERQKTGSGGHFYARTLGQHGWQTSYLLKRKPWRFYQWFMCFLAIAKQ